MNAPKPLALANEQVDVAADRTHWKGATLARILDHIHAIFVPHPLAAKVIHAINQRILIRRSVSRGRGLLILAPPDGGKTRLIGYLSGLYPPEEVVEGPSQADPEGGLTRTVRPFLAISIPNPCSVLSVCNAILAALNHPDCHGKDGATQKELVIDQLKVARTLILAVDNVQDIPELRGPRGTSSIGGTFRDFIEYAHVVALFFGTGKAEIVISANDQLRKRVPAPLHLGGYDVSTEVGLVSAMKLLTMIDQQLPFPKPSRIGLGALGVGLACAADGKVGAMIDILLASAPHARKAHRDYIDIEDARKGYADHYLDYATSVDPFAIEFKPRRLILPGEPHFTAIDDRKVRSRRRAEP